ncbi:MAG: Gfo/Idh/MocA family oxidoreductase [Nitrospirae bacterium]|nr:Gfo/Idh/MocA family oxidoreductase [Nitrospirota bacterium]
MGLRVAVIGTGYLGRHHARVFSEIEETELVGVVDLDKERAGEIAGNTAVRRSWTTGTSFRMWTPSAL